MLRALSLLLLGLGIPGGPAFLSAPVRAQEGEAWVPLFTDKMDAFTTVDPNWVQVGAVELNAANPRQLMASEGQGVFYNGPKGNARNLFTRQKFADVELHLEFCMPKGSNSGVKFHGHYEIQLADSFGVQKLEGEHCGGIYPRAEKKPSYHHIDKGIAPKVNACKEPGQWQTLDVIFLAPRFDAQGKKTANAKILRATLNGQVIHENQELQTPTGDRWQNPEMREGPLMIQGDHGPVAFRDVRVRAVRP